MACAKSKSNATESQYHTLHGICDVNRANTYKVGPRQCCDRIDVSRILLRISLLIESAVVNDELRVARLIGGVDWRLIGRDIIGGGDDASGCLIVEDSASERNVN